MDSIKLTVIFIFKLFPSASVQISTVRSARLATDSESGQKSDSSVCVRRSVLLFVRHVVRNIYKTPGVNIEHGEVCEDSLFC